MNKPMRWILGSLTLGLAGAALAISGCSQAPATGGQTAAKSTTPPIFAADANKSGAQLWAETCMRCHNMRSPDEFSDAQWSVITEHMRLRANLTGEEQRKILAFLKSAN